MATGIRNGEEGTVDGFDVDGPDPDLDDEPDLDCDLDGDGDLDLDLDLDGDGDLDLDLDGDGDLDLDGDGDEGAAAGGDAASDSASTPPNLGGAHVMALFTAPWCAIDSQLRAAAADNVTIVDVETWGFLADQYKVSVLPTVLTLKAGVETLRHVGLSVLPQVRRGPSTGTVTV